MSSIRLNCFLHGEAESDIFSVEIDNNLTVKDLKEKIKDTRQDLRQKNFDLYEVNFFQPNHSIVSSVNIHTAGQGEFMIPIKEISGRYFTRINALIESPPYPQENGKRGPIHVLMYPHPEKK